LHQFLYLRTATANIAYQDYLGHTHILEKLYAHTLTFWDLWSPYNTFHRVPGGLGIYLLNALLFRLDTRIELYLTIAWLVPLSILLFVAFRRSLGTPAGWAVQLSFVPILVILFSLAQWENYVFSGGAYHVLQAFVFVAAFIALDRLARAPGRGGMLAFAALASPPCSCLLRATPSPLRW